MFERFSLDGKTALITGASRGLGREMAIAMAEAGADLIITGRDGASLGTTAERIGAVGRSCVEVVGDLSDPEACRETLEAVVRDHGPVDVLVNNVGGRRYSEAIEAQSLATWQAAIDLNLTTCFLGMQIVGGAMVERGSGGRVINVASINAMICNRGIGGRSYEAAKAAVVQLTRAAAADWAPHGVNVNAICPGLFMTDANKAWQDKKPEVIDNLVAGIPMGRAGEPPEIGPLAVFLASPASSYITGASFVIDGGYTLW